MRVHVDLPVTPPVLEDREPLKAAGRPRSSVCLGGGRGLFPGSTKHLNTGLRSATTASGRTDTGNRSLRPPGAPRTHSWEGSGPEGGVKGPSSGPRAAPESVILSDDSRAGGCLLLLLRETSCH
ncbi:hypothetical protein CesoFtcFv8_008351 [Champsocephalus esox]|nr:hypothetical protein CesoFtcFv8_008351 [Champsocephalus esox]KAK5925929.1 hypothetical protein CgunFtcFv8_021543 [Champsocephalus gunnari]